LGVILLEMCVAFATGMEVKIERERKERGKRERF
jgi:hypothetical protein